MIWPFRKCDCEQRIRDLKQERDQADDAYMAVVQANGEAEAAMLAMQSALTDEGVADLARRATAEIADIYATAGRSVAQRDIAVHAVVAAAVRKAAKGVRAWDEAQQARKAREVANG